MEYVQRCLLLFKEFERRDPLSIHRNAIDIHVPRINTHTITNVGVFAVAGANVADVNISKAGTSPGGSLANQSHTNTAPPAIPTVTILHTNCTCTFGITNNSSLVTKITSSVKPIALCTHRGNPTYPSTHAYHHAYAGSWSDATAIVVTNQHSAISSAVCFQSTLESFELERKRKYIINTREGHPTNTGQNPIPLPYLPPSRMCGEPADCMVTRRSNYRFEDRVRVQVYVDYLHVYCVIPILRPAPRRTMVYNNFEIVLRVVNSHD
eukprot:m.97343 g.97343  ORF g.97343 m.97343 type:complete len:266 (-) comp26969_c0_seq1:166-963(-)